MIKKRDYRPCEAGCLIYSMCKISDPFTHDLQSSSLLHQCIRDLKASVFLLWFGHYRNSIQILRPIIENFLTALYFDIKFNHANNDHQRETIQEDYKRFCRNEYEVPKNEWFDIFPKAEPRRHYYLNQNFLLGWLLERGRISGKDKNRIQKIIGFLNIYLHPHVGYMEISKDCSPDCPALVAWDDDEYEKCIRFLQNIIAELLWLFLDHIKRFYFRRLECKRTKSVLDEVKQVFKILEDYEVEDDKKLIFSERLRNFSRELG